LGCAQEGGVDFEPPKRYMSDWGSFGSIVAVVEMIGVVVSMVA